MSPHPRPSPIPWERSERSWPGVRFHFTAAPLLKTTVRRLPCGQSGTIRRRPGRSSAAGPISRRGRPCRCGGEPPITGGGHARGIVGLGAAACGLSAAPARPVRQRAVPPRRPDPRWSASYDDCYIIGTLQDLEALLAVLHQRTLSDGQATEHAAGEASGTAVIRIGPTHSMHSSDFAGGNARRLRPLAGRPPPPGGSPPCASPAHLCRLSDSFRGLCEEMGLVVAWWTHDRSYRTGLGRIPGAALQG